MYEEQHINHRKESKEEVHAVAADFENGLLGDLVHGVIGKLGCYLSYPVGSDESG